MKKIEKETSDKINRLSGHIKKISDESLKVEKKKKDKKPSFRTSEVVVLVFLTAFISLIVGSMVTYKMTSSTTKYSKVDDELQSFVKTYEEIKINYYKDINKEKLIDGAISGMLGTLDEYSSYYTEGASNNINIKLEGEYEGLGVEVYNNEDGDIVVSNIINNSPASKAGLKQGDILIKYNNKSIKKTDISDFVKIVKENTSKDTTLTYVRDGKENVITISKNNIELRSVDSQTFNDGKDGYIYISVFASNTQKQFKEELDKLEKSGIESLIIDLRNNSGGHLTTAEKITSMFLDKSHPIYQIKTKDKITKYYSTGKKTKDYKIVVLVNSMSASASEILASALKEQYGATLVGEKTYGKGTVQEMQTLSTGAQFKLTTKNWLTSNGKYVDGKGIDVDVEVKLDDNYAKNPKIENDNQLKTALEEANK